MSKLMVAGPLTRWAVKGRCGRHWSACATIAAEPLKKRPKLRFLHVLHHHPYATCTDSSTKLSLPRLQMVVAEQ
jgi:hypothetical protein